VSASTAVRLPVREAERLFDASARGQEEMLGVLEGRPLLVVDLDGGAPVRLRVPTGLPAVVVGVGARAAPVGPGVDVALTAAEPPGPAWVRVPDEDEALDFLADRVTAAPIPAVTLVQVLRTGAGLDLAAALVVESLAYSALQAGPDHVAWVRSRQAPSAAAPGRGAAVELARRGSELTLTLARPERHNAYSAEMRDALAEGLAAAAADPTVESVSLRGAGPSFCSGGDLAEFGTRSDPATAHLIRTARSCARAIAALQVPVTAYLHGHCIGAGIELAAAADVVVADRSTRIALPELSMGLIPGAGGTATLPPRIGTARTAWLALTGATIDAATALQWELVDRIADDPSASY
jgi:enoyl-CoA hydratase/carnithine racemase